MKILQNGIYNKQVSWQDGIEKRTGHVVLVYTEAIASGTRDYVPITMLLIVDENDKAHSVRPRDLLDVNLHDQFKSKIGSEG